MLQDGEIIEAYVSNDKFFAESEGKKKQRVNFTN